MLLLVTDRSCCHTRDQDSMKAVECDIGAKTVNSVSLGENCQPSGECGERSINHSVHALPIRLTLDSADLGLHYAQQ